MTNILRKTALPLLALGLGVVACDDPTDVGGHPAAEGIAIMQGADELYRYMLTDEAPAPLDLVVGTHEVAFVFLDGAGDPIPHEEHEEGEEEELAITIEDPDVLTWTAEDHGVGGEPDFLEFHGELDALSAASTSMEVCLLHGQHCDFEVTIPVGVSD